MENKSNVIKKAVHGFKFTLLAQIVVLVLGVLKSVILPKVLSIPDYGYWQVYVLYSTYVGVFSLGFNDGVYLLYGKYQYEELPFAKLRSATRFYIGMLVVFTILGYVLSMYIGEEKRGFALFATSIDVVILGINGLLIYVLQITNQMKAYSLYSVLDKFFMLFAVIAISLGATRNFRMIIIADVVSKGIVTVGLLVKCKEFVIGKCSNLREGWEEFTSDIKIGINLMIANLMGMFVTGIGRFIVDTLGDISQYAYYSFGITITNLVLVFITAVSLVLYPALKRLPEKDYGNYFEKINFSVGFFNNLALFAYFPSVIFIQKFLPQYEPILAYLHFLFGVVILQSKMQLINTTFYKVLREEKALLKANLSCVFFFTIMSLLFYSIVTEVWTIAVCTFIAMLYRCYSSEIFLRKGLKLTITKDVWFEMLYIILFVIITTMLNLAYAFVVYIFLFIFYVVSNYNKWRVVNIKRFLKR